MAALVGLLVAGGFRGGALPESSPAGGPAPRDPGPGFAAGAVQAASDRRRQPFEWRGRISAGGTIEIKGVNGTVRAHPAPGDEGVVQAEKQSMGGDTSTVRIEAVEEVGGVTVCALYPNRRGRTPTCRSGGGGDSDVRDSRVRVNFDVRVPRGAVFVARNVNGDVSADSLAGPVQVQDVNGSVHIATSSQATAETVNGSIEAQLGSTVSRAPLSFSTVNGRIRLTVPPGSGADVEATTLNGRISSDVPLDAVTRAGRRKLSGRIGSGGARLELSTVNGDIQLRAAEEPPE